MSVTKLNCIAVDDENLARKLLQENIEQVPFLNLVKVCKNPYEAMEALQENKIDLMFLDIQMPGMLGTKFLASLKDKPLVILVTAYDNYAVESYDLDVVDYLMKPVSFDRFSKAAHKALDLYKKSKPSVLINEAGVSIQEPESFFVNVEYSLVKIIFNDITHIEGLKDYIKIFITTQTRPILTKSTLKGIEERLPSNFMRVQKSYIVNLDKIQSIRNHRITIDKFDIPVSDSNMEDLMNAINYQKS
ncbi:LytR/AlgR family response regulator transcription factor [Arcticibacterium luteifluviistationis]|uniref:DNA-binding response regulator n=1 Tax=Arcticibacterium luteifluviistationis TaxID=1784714 RepID=A0A2Z4GG04_9BACT|nr:LytTR family DNA-binding domain-containing protein [Arcticibacterium luteifluviistationis]AWW00181.1 DNA-binding response regulator [Arcticibacterium luteifluviistationis]